MQVQTDRGAGRVFAFVAADRELPFPQRDPPWAPFKIIDLVRGQSQLGVNVDACLDDIVEHSLHITDAHVRITERAIG